MNYVYILKSLKDSELYIGSTQDLRKRLQEHNQGKNYSTRNRRPFELIYYEAYKSLKDARQREHSLKMRGNTRKHLLNRISCSLV